MRQFDKNAEVEKRNDFIEVHSTVSPGGYWGMWGGKCSALDKIGANVTVTLLDV